MTDTPISETDRLIALAKEVAGKFGLDPALVCAVAEQESGWNPWATRYEALFFSKYVAPLYTSNKIGATEAYMRGMSWGLMQVMGQTAREKGVTVKFLSQLCDPEAGISIGCQKLSDELHRLGGDVRAALLAYNGGGALHYPDEVLARMEHYQCQPPTTAP
jgi:soluble lytic murein transglycosylase-like protein